MPDKQFDHIINQKVRDAKVDVPKSDWNVFSQKLKVAMEHSGPEDSLFDEAIKSKLAAASLDIPKSDWSAFAPQLQDSIQADISDTDFDKAILDKVNNPNIPVPAADWNQFAEKLADAQFDASIKEKVENPDIKLPKPEWAVLAAMLTSTHPVPQELSDAEFDSVIQDKMVDSNIEIPESNWNAFSQKMQHADLSDQQMDQEVKSKLDNYSSRYEESHWAILREKMLETKYLRRNLYGLKWFEAALSILLFMTFANFVADSLMPSAQPMAESITKESNATIETGANTITAEAFSRTTEESHETANQTATHETTYVAEESKASQLSKIANSTQANSTINSKTPTKSNTNIYGSGNNNNNGAASKKPNAGLILTPIIREEENNTRALIENKVVADATPITTNDEPRLNAFNQIELLTPGLFAHNRDLLDPAFSMATMISTEKKEKTNHWNLYLASGVNTHLIYTPRDTAVFFEAYSRSASNIAYDLRIGKEINDIEIMSGLTYQRMQYQSELKEDLGVGEDVYLFSIDNIRYDFVKIPLNVRWNYDLNQKFGFFADLGLSANILMNAEYDIIKELFVEQVDPGSINQPVPVPTPGTSTTEDLDFNNTAHAYKNYQMGVLDGASLRESIIGNLDSGIGVKYRFAPGIESYARATMSLSLIHI